MPTEQKFILKNGLNELREFSLMLVRFLASLDMDPHGYFERQYVSRIERSLNDEEIFKVLVELLQWVENNEMSDEHRIVLGKKLENFGMPDLINFRH